MGLQGFPTTQSRENTNPHLTRRSPTHKVLFPSIFVESEKRSQGEYVYVPAFAEPRLPLIAWSFLSVVWIVPRTTGVSFLVWIKASSYDVEYVGIIHKLLYCKGNSMRFISSASAVS